jgi:hypothetical protein
VVSFLFSLFSNISPFASMSFFISMWELCRGYSWQLHVCLQCILTRSTPHIIPPHLSSPVLEQFQQVSLFYSHTSMQISAIFPLIHPLCLPPPLPLYPHPDRTCVIFLPFI